MKKKNWDILFLYRAPGFVPPWTRAMTACVIFDIKTEIRHHGKTTKNVVRGPFLLRQSSISYRPLGTVQYNRVVVLAATKCISALQV